MPDPTQQREERWHLIDNDPENAYDVAAARWPCTVHHGQLPAFFNGQVVPASRAEQAEAALEVVEGTIRWNLERGKLPTNEDLLILADRLREALSAERKDG